MSNMNTVSVEKASEKTTKTTRQVANQIQFVLVETSHPGNIGAVARAIKTMGFGRLVLVNPKQFPDDEATSRASGAADVLENALVVSTLEEALSDSDLVVGTSVREREISWPTFTARDTATKIKASIDDKSVSKVSILFGRERTGLENHELDQASWQVRIPANEEYSSLNLGSAVQIISYELRCALLEGSDKNEKGERDETREPSKLEQRQRLATHTEMQSYYAHLEKTLLDLDFIKTNPPTKLLRKVQRLYNRAEVSFEELQILRGVLTAVDKKLDK